jgi:cytochrome c oxidase subunit II
VSDYLAILLPDASSACKPNDLLFNCLWVMSLFLTLGIAATVLWFAVKYRRREEGQFGHDIGTHTGVELTWIVIPLLICLGIFVWSAFLYADLSRPPPNAMVIQVLGKQWMWKIQHPSGRKEIDELHVPLGRPVKLQMTSQDVIHSFFIPAFRIKQDVLPGRYSQEWFTATQIGEYHFFCSQFCGTSHASMVGRVIVMPPAEYDKWAAGVGADDRPETAGARLFAQYGCITCHGQQGSTLAGIYGHEQVMQDGERVTVDDNYLRESIISPRAKIVAGFQPIMPSYEGQLTEEQIFDLLAYIKSLREPVSPPPVPVPEAPVLQPGANPP